MTPDMAREALSISREARQYLEEAYDRLESAGRFGLWDIFGGGALSWLLKHNRMDEAESSIRRARGALTRLGTTLREDAPEIEGVDTGWFGRFADLCMDGLFADLYMQGRIRDAQERIQNTLASLDSLDRLLIAQAGDKSIPRQ